MTLDGFIVLLTLAATIYAITTNANRLKFWLRVGWLRLGLVALTFLAVNYLEFYKFFQHIGYALPFDFDKAQISPEAAAYLLVLLCAALLWLSFRIKFVWTTDVHKLAPLTDELINEERYADLIDVLSEFLPSIERAYENKYLSSRLREYFTEPSFFERAWQEAREREQHPDREVTQTDDWLPVKVRAAVNVAGRRLVSYLPNHEAEIAKATGIVRATLLSPTVNSFIAKARPGFAIRVMGHSPFQEVPDFAGMYLANLMADSRSALYFEIKFNQNCTSREGYEYPASNRLLHFLFSDANVAERLNIWQPVGEYLLRGPSSIRNRVTLDGLNDPVDGFSEDGKWQNPIYIGIRFFDLMVSAALHQDIEWHMWLYYFPHFTDALIEIYDATGPRVEADATYPTKAAFLLYELFDVLAGWVRFLRDHPNGQKNLVLKRADTNHENGNIVKSALLALGLCLKSLIEADNVGAPLKQSVFDLCLGLFRDINRDETRGYANVMMQTIRVGGFYAHERDDGYRATLRQLFQGADTSRQEDAEELGQFLGAV